MDDNILDPDGARERLAAWKNRIDKLAADTQAMSTQLQGLRITAKDSGGLAEVTIDSTGALVDLKLTDRIQRTSPETVAQTIMATLGDARSQLADRSQEIIADTVGTESAAGRAIADSVGRQLRGTPVEPQAPADDPDEDYDVRSHLRRR
ncbi:YbaB/EbfC family nucleoid-associated protein [Kibdelosporangium persicum]|uniref:DNA-binding protein YbaB n=1 Tax=Kibdelosporangium persicum TaxID=2698649 RepID=A0ABX2FB31_9PSEU|nr:YbaB/EbfC family nucleoid-associated protein [Kibdelosporangium persicum]NRN68339.1 DNA-binding protein YbaB [Kibdelosporangium persicum]